VGNRSLLLLLLLLLLSPLSGLLLLLLLLSLLLLLLPCHIQAPARFPVHAHQICQLRQQC
jgi:hypothetical protein